MEIEEPAKRASLLTTKKTIPKILLWFGVGFGALLLLLVLLHCWLGFWLFKYQDTHEFGGEPCRWLLEKAPLWLIGKGLIKAGDSSYLELRGSEAVPYYIYAINNPKYPFDFEPLNRYDNSLIPFSVDLLKALLEYPHKHRQVNGAFEFEGWSSFHAAVLNAVLASSDAFAYFKGYYFSDFQSKAEEERLFAVSILDGMLSELYEATEEPVENQELKAILLGQINDESLKVKLKIVNALGLMAFDDSIEKALCKMATTDEQDELQETVLDILQDNFSLLSDVGLKVFSISSDE